MTVMEGHYSDYVAVRNYFSEPEHLAELDAVCARIRQHGIEDVALGAPLSNIVINVSVLDADGDVLILQRSDTVKTYARAWQVGAHETMNWSTEYRAGDPEDVPETCFGMARRALREEIGLEPDHYNSKIVFSWFGLYVKDASFYFFAHTKSRLAKAEIEYRVRRHASHSWETRAISWIPFRQKALREVVESWAGVSGIAPVSQVDRHGRTWLPHSPISVVQLWRARNML